LLAQEMMAW
jgi:hypothetical protein